MLWKMGPLRFFLVVVFSSMEMAGRLRGWGMCLWRLWAKNGRRGCFLQRFPLFFGCLYGVPAWLIGRAVKYVITEK